MCPPTEAAMLWQVNYGTKVGLISFIIPCRLTYISKKLGNKTTLLLATLNGRGATVPEKGMGVSFSFDADIDGGCGFKRSLSL